MPDAKQEFLCRVCGRIDEYPFGAEPYHCYQPMEANRSLVRGGDPLAVSLSLVEYVRPERKFPVPWLNFEDDLQGTEWRPPPDWDPCYEVWQLRPGRRNGERIGWLGRSSLGWRYRMVKGIPEALKEGAALTREEALYQMWLTINS